MADKEINNQRDFFKEVVLNEEGELKTTQVERQGELVSPENAETFFQRIALNEDGSIKTTV